jgi:hypothetical protein
MLENKCVFVLTNARTHFKLRGGARGPPALTLFSGRVPINNALLSPNASVSWGFGTIRPLDKMLNMEFAAGTPSGKGIRDLSVIFPLL